jgi:hypothetical protein
VKNRTPEPIDDILCRRKLKSTLKKLTFFLSFLLSFFFLSFFLSLSLSLKPDLIIKTSGFMLIREPFDTHCLYVDHVDHVDPALFLQNFNIWYLLYSSSTERFGGHFYVK